MTTMKKLTISGTGDQATVQEGIVNGTINGITDQGIRGDKALVAHMRLR